NPEAGNTVVLVGDVADESILEEAKRIAGREFDVVLSDMSPKLSGIKSVDQVASTACAELAFWASQQCLKPGGSFVAKVFKGNESENFFRSLREHFAQTKRFELRSTRKSSNEFYIVGLGFKPAET
ncbi:MAG: hypothetical protein KDD53_10065, partial [Bdellovibrionales bacterium]|nr:hypothetical protein [Bdellovibrionales bacterium]